LKFIQKKRKLKFFKLWNCSLVKTKKSTGQKVHSSQARGQDEVVWAEGLVQSAQAEGRAEPAQVEGWAELT